MLKKERIIWGLLLIPLVSFAYPADGWRGLAELKTSIGSPPRPRIAVVDDTLHIAVLDNSNDVYYVRSRNGGFGFDSPVKVCGDSSHEVKSTIAIGADMSNVIIIWCNYYHWRLRYCYSTDNGQNWSDPAEVDIGVTAGEDYGNPAVTVRADSAFFVCFERESDQLTYAKFRFDTNSWGDVSVVDGVGWDPWDDPCQDCWITIKNDNPHIVYTDNKSEGYDLKHARWNGSGWTKNTIYTTDEESYYCKHCEVDWSVGLGDETAKLYVIWSHYNGVNTEQWFKQSANNGADWQYLNDFGDYYCGSINHDGYHPCVIYGSGSDLYYCHSTDYGENWQSPVQITDGVSVGYADDVNFDGGYTGFHVGVRTSSSVSHLAKDDSLFSGTAMATAYNNGRHLIRASGDDLHLVYTSSYGGDKYILWSKTTNGGTDWQPYRQVGKGQYPALAIPSFIGPSGVYLYMAYLSENSETLNYRYYQESSDSWSSATKICSTSNTLHAPSIVNKGDTVYVVFVEDYSGSDDSVRCYWFKYDDPDPIIKDVADHNDGLYMPSVYRDGNGDLHAAWRRGNDIIYKKKTLPGHDNWMNEKDVSETSGVTSHWPFVEVWGDSVFVPWTENTGNSSEIYRRARCISTGNWGSIINVSNSNNISSQYGTFSSQYFVVWSEYNTNDYDIEYLSYYSGGGSGWIWQSQPIKSYFAHSQSEPVMGGLNLYTAWTEGDNSPFRISSEMDYFMPSQFAGGGNPIWYAVECGQNEPSYFLVERDGFINYGSYQIDYDSEELIYDLELLDAKYDYYLLAVSYHEGDERIESWVIDGSDEGEFTYQSGTAQETMVQIPYEVYAEDNKARVVFRNTSGSFAAKADLKLICVDHNPSFSGGSQSGGTSKLTKSTSRIAPNPTIGKVNVELNLAKSSRLKISLYDISGRKIGSLYNKKLSRGNHNLSLSMPKSLASGIYFMVLESGDLYCKEKLILRH